MRYLGLDLGARSLGIAISDRTGLIASFYKSIRYDSEDKLLSDLEKIIKDENVDKIVLGYPKNMDNSEGPRCEKTRAYKERLEKRFPAIPVILWDERLSTVAADRSLMEASVSAAKRKQVIDKMAAVHILQGYLNSVK